jgi:predicted nucleotidyltransferase
MDKTVQHKDDVVAILLGHRLQIKSLGRRVELITPESLSPYIKPHILEQTEYVAIAA